MAPSAPFPRIGRGSVDPALTLKNQIARPDDSRPAWTPPAGPRRDLPEASPRAEALDAKWQSAIDAATD